jgi:predicted acetyltransferase
MNNHCQEYGHGLASTHEVGASSMRDWLVIEIREAKSCRDRVDEMQSAAVEKKKSRITKDKVKITSIKVRGASSHHN